MSNGSATRPRNRKPRGSIGRPKAETVKDRYVSFRVTADEFFAIAEKAQRSGMSHGDYARSRTLRGIARAKPAKAVTQPVFGDDTRQVFHEVRRQGINLNQIARLCNATKMPPPPEIKELASTLLALWQKLLAP